MNLKNPEKSTEILLAITKAQQEFINHSSPKEIFEKLLQNFLDFTESEYGFIGEVMKNSENLPFLKTHALTNIAWNEETKAFYETHAPSGMEFTNLDTLFGHVLKTGEAVISNNPATDKKAGGIPAGHPPLNSFLGVPVFANQEFLGMIGVANRKEGYNEEIVQNIQPLLQTYGSLIHAYRTENSRKETEQKLQSARKDAEKANLAKSEFLSSMSHELRTPLNAIMGFAQLLQTDDQLTEEATDHINEIEKASEQLLSLINDILDYSEIESQTMSIETTSISLKEVIEEARAAMQNPIEIKNINVIIEQDELDIPLKCDRKRISQVILHVLTNACKYNRQNGGIHIFTERREPDFIHLHISDTGHGIPKEKERMLFEPFNRLGAEMSNIEGTGIGLVIAKNLMTLMGGDIGFTSTFNIGSDFWIKIPVYLTVSKSSTKPSIKRVLYIEDSPSNLVLMKNIFKKRNDLKLLYSASAELGLELSSSLHPDLIIMDINLPGINGYEALARLRENKATAGIPVFALTSDAKQSQQEAGLKAGFNEYIVKPANIDELLNKIDRAINPDTV